MDYTAKRQHIVGVLDEVRRETDDPVFARALQRVTSIAVWVVDQNRYKPHVSAVELRDNVMHEIDLYRQKMFIDGFGDMAFHDAVVRCKELVEKAFQEIIDKEAAAAEKATV